jgi:hypothetical protein
VKKKSVHWMRMPASGHKRRFCNFHAIGRPRSTLLAAGEIVTTGTLTRAIPVKSGEIWSTALKCIRLSGIGSHVLNVCVAVVRVLGSVVGHFRPRQRTLPPRYFRFAPIRDITLSSSAARSAPPPIAMERRLRAGLSGVFRKRAAGFGFRGCCRN